MLNASKPDEARERRSLLILCGLAFAAVLYAVAPLIRSLPDVWFGYETYYAPGAVVPICSAFMIWDRSPRIKDLPLEGSNWALLPAVPILFLLWCSLRSDMHSLMSLMLIAVLLCGTWYVAGARWVKALFIPIVYLLFALPVVGPLIDRLTQPLQHTSQSIAFTMLRLAD